MKYLRNLNYLLISIVVLSSCSVHNRLTSPEVLDKKERIVSVGGSVDPLSLTQYGAVPDPVAIFQPIVGYRTGLGARQEIGVTLYGILGPAVVFDYKHKFIDTERFMLTGDLALFGGMPVEFPRPTGVQYELIFGNQYTYYSAGIGYHLYSVITQKPYYVFGLGYERISESPWGLQISFGQSLQTTFRDGENFLSVGVKYDFLRKKKKYRN